MNNKVKSLIKMYKYLHYRNAVSLFLYISMILMGVLLNIATLFMYSANLLVIAILCIFVIEDLLFKTDYYMYSLNRNTNEEYLSFLPVSKEDYLKSKVFYTTYVIGKIMLITFITINLVLRSFIINNIFLMSSALNIIIISINIFRDRNSLSKYDNRKVVDQKSNLMGILFILCGFLLPEILSKYKNSTFFKITSLNYMDLSRGISSVAVLMLIISIIIYIAIMKIIILRKDSE